MKKLLPFLRWFPLDKGVLRADFIAGLTVALVLIPQSMAYAELAGLPSYYGLYAAFLPVMIAALWGSSSQLATGPVAVVSLLTAATLMTIANHGNITSMADYVSLAIVLALMVGVIQLFLGVFRLGVIVNFLSHTVIIGFTNAAAMIIGLSQLYKVFGIPKYGVDELGVENESSGWFLVDIFEMLSEIGSTHMLTFMMALIAFSIMWVLKKHIPKVPGVLFAVIITVILSATIDFEQHGGSVVGVIPAGLPGISTPTVAADAARVKEFEGQENPFAQITASPSMETTGKHLLNDNELLLKLFFGALIISLVGFMEAISIAKAMSGKTKERIDPSQELIGQGLSNIAGSFAQSYPVSGSFSRSAVNLNAGALTGLSSVFTAIIVLITLIFLTEYLYHLPKSVLAVVIIMAVLGLINFSAIGHAWQANKHDGIAALVTFVATLVFAPHLENGIMLGAGLAIILFLYRTMKPRIAFLGRHEDNTFRDAQVNKLEQSEAVVLIRYDGSLYFANVSYFEDAVIEAMAVHKKAKYILIVGDGINQLDASGEEIIHKLYDRLLENNVQLILSGFKKQVLDVMRNTNLFYHIRQDNIFPTKEIALANIFQRLAKVGYDVSKDPLVLKPA